MRRKMRRKMIKRNCKKTYTSKNKAFILAMVIIGAFTACGKADRENIEEDLRENVTSDYATKSDAVQEEIPESLSYTVTAGDNGAVKVEAEVSSEGYGSDIPAYKLKKRDKNDEWVQSYAEKLFDNGEYVNVKPYDFCSLEELETEKQFWEERLMTLTEGSNGYSRVESEIAYIEYLMEHFSESDYVKYPEEQLIFKRNSHSDDDDSTDYYENSLLRGEVDGDVWLLNYDYTMYEYEGQEEIHVPVLYGSCLEKMDYISGDYGMEAGIYKNKCDRETAESEALKLLDRLGFHNMECVKITELHPNYNSGNADYFDGYCIIYGPSLNGIKIFSGISCGANADDEYVAIQPYVSVIVNSEGAYSFCIMEDYVVEEKFSENSQMLSFQQIDDIAHTEFEKMMGENPKFSYDIKKVKFEYLCVTYDGISYAMLPVWTYYTEWIVYGDTEASPVLIINALDGAVIDSTYVYANWEYYFIIQ